MHPYQTDSKAWASKFLTSQSDALVLATRPSNSYGTQFVLGEFSLHNRSGGAAVMGIGGRLPINLWSAGLWDDSAYVAGTAYIDDTIDAQDAGTDDFLLGTTSTNDDGLLLSCLCPFNIASILVSTAVSGGSPTWKLHYSIASTGTGQAANWAEITNAYVMPLFTATGEQLIWFEPPTDWVPVTAATAIINRHGLGVPLGYGIKATQNAAGTTSAGLGTLAVLGRMFYSTEGIPDNDVLNNIGGIEIPLPAQCDAICAAISVANVQNRADCKWRYT